MALARSSSEAAPFRFASVLLAPTGPHMASRPDRLQKPLLGPPHTWRFRDHGACGRRDRTQFVGERPAQPSNPNGIRFIENTLLISVPPHSKFITPTETPIRIRRGTGPAHRLP